VVMSRVVRQGGGSLANLHLVVLPQLSGIRSIVNESKGWVELRTVFGSLYFQAEDRVAIAAYLSDLADAILSSEAKS